MLLAVQSRPKGIPTISTLERSHTAMDDHVPVERSIGGERSATYLTVVVLGSHVSFQMSLQYS